MTDDASRQGPGSTDSTRDEPRIVVVTQDGMGVSSSNHDAGSDREGGDGERRGDGQEHPEPRERTNPADLVEEPAKVMRIGSMIKQLLEEVRNAPLDEAGRRRLADVHHRSLEELKDGLAPELVAELDRIALPFRDESPSDAELRIAQAQLVGWLEGLFHGIQTALVAQQMAAQQQLQQMRALPPGPGASYGTPPGMPPGEHHPGESGPTGQYL
ncbi:bacterial proteasome activator family protein [Terrabacter lapilli]|uniref:Bacterial proteasome activator n=1 Tax=Terrabacter lapilli TaxID=436231 RepID=A0ABP5DK25_9MICO|nr:bacterial proteasome activator family protein [Terrabacter sp.]